MTNLKEKLHQNELTLGTWVTLGNAGIAEIFAGSGLDWVTIDLEHSVIDMTQAENLIRTIELKGAAPLVRLSSNDPVQIKRVMDAGAHGIIVPMVNSTEEAEAAAAAMYYPPRGNRGVGLARAQGYTTGLQEYMTQLAERAILIPQVEHKDAVDNIDAILANKEVDGVFIGPYDLSASLGVPGQFDHPKMLEALTTVEKAVRKANKALGIHIIQPEEDQLKLFHRKGYRFIAYSLDFMILDSAMRQAVKFAQSIK